MQMQLSEGMCDRMNLAIHKNLAGEDKSQQISADFDQILSRSIW
jgi:hypothetical protein